MASKWVYVRQQRLFPAYYTRRPPKRKVLVASTRPRRHSSYTRLLMQMHRDYRHQNAIAALQWGLSYLMEVQRLALSKHTDQWQDAEAFAEFMRDIKAAKEWLKNQIRIERAKRRRAA